MPTATAPRLQPVLDRIDRDFDAAVARLRDLLRIRSVSTDPAYAAETRAAADFLAADLRSMGFTAQVRPTPGHPMVVAHHDGPGPHLLYYGHYDVQPPDPLDEWTSPPFDPQVVEGPHGPRLVARGAVDDKGQLMTFLEAFRAWKGVHGSLPIRVTVLLEGEEESGSHSLAPFLREHRGELKAEAAIVCDTGMWDIDTPAITYMLRGLLYTEVELRGPSHDLHSGMYGGAVVNPNNALCRVLSQLVDEHGRVRIPGFYDDVRELDPQEAAAWKGLEFDDAAFLRSAGLPSSAGEKGRSVLERIWSRPTCDVNGVWGGYTGPGAKTVIPARASAKVSCRLVPDQDPERIFAGLKRFFEERRPSGCRWEFRQHGASPAIRVPAEAPHMDAVREGLKDIYGVEPVMMGCGGSIPVVGMIHTILGFDALLVGFGLEDDRVHSPNEKFELRCFRQGMKSHAAIMARLAQARR
jgi:acetylornithine deacetylase/succinyl-diaminopimelate desuccinylase-like protein